MPAQNHLFQTNSKITKIEDLTWCVKLMILTRRSSPLPLDVFFKLTLFSSKITDNKAQSLCFIGCEAWQGG